MLEYANLKALAVVVSEGGFERAAKVLHITQSAVSQRVRQLEERVGQSLLIRSTPVVATPTDAELVAQTTPAAGSDNKKPPADMSVAITNGSMGVRS